MSQSELNQTKPPFNYVPPPYVWRLWMRDCTFIMKGRMYKVVGGTTIVKDKELCDAIKFEDVLPKGQEKGVINVYTLTEKEFFKKVKIEQLKFPN